MNETIEIVDRGRGPQLSTSRITVQDLVPYFQRQCTHEQIIAVMPVLTVAEIEVVERYVRDHHQEVMEQDRHIRERNANRKNPPQVEEILRRGGERMAALREQFQKAANVWGRLVPRVMDAPEKLPAEERNAWRKLGDDVAALLKKSAK